MQKIETWFCKQTAETPMQPAFGGEYFFVKSGKVLIKVLLDDIIYFEGEKEYVRLVTAQEQILILPPLKRY